MKTIAPDVPRMLLLATLIGLGLAALPQVLGAQLVVENPRGRWTAGETVELVLRDPEIRRGIRIDQILFDGQPIPFEEIGTRPREGEMRLRVRVPATIKPAAGHQISVRYLSETSAVPALLGLPLDEARRRLAARGLRLDTGEWRGESTELVSHTVARQKPAAGTNVRPGTRIAVEVSSTSEVPDVRGLPLDEARRGLAARGFELDSAALPAGAVAWVIEETAPPAGARLATGSRIFAVVAGGVPDLVGRQIDAARSLVLAGGLVPVVVILEPSAGPFETVLRQEPQAGQPVSPGSLVSMVIESRPDPPLRWPWPWLAATAGLSLLLRQRIRLRRKKLRRSFRIEGHNDLDRLLGQATPVDEDHVPRLDVRLLGRLDPGRQTIECDGPLVAEETPR